MRAGILAVVLGMVIVATVAFPLHGGEPAARIARLGVVYTVSRSSASIGYTVDFWERLRELGWTPREDSQHSMAPILVRFSASY
jgi:hypothetical protein